MNKKNYYVQRDESYYKKMTKEEIQEKVNPFIPSTFLPILKDMNYPYIATEWLYTLQNVNEVNKLERCLGKYISKMRLKGYKLYTWKDTEYLNDMSINYIERHYCNDQNN